MTRKGLLRFALAGVTLSLVLPLAAHASEVGPLRVQPPADTLTKLEKAKAEKALPATKKKLKPHATPTAGAVKSDFFPDQPWETDFYVDNDISGRHAIQLALATFPGRR